MWCVKAVYVVFYPNITLNDHEILISLSYSLMRINVASLMFLVHNIHKYCVKPYWYLFPDTIWRSNSHIHEKSHLYERSCFSLNPISLLRERHPDVETEEGLSLGQSFLRPNSGIRSPRGVCAGVDSGTAGRGPRHYYSTYPHYRTVHFSTCRSLSFLQRWLQLKLNLTDKYSMAILGPTA